jgi:hypothetical protein
MPILTLLDEAIAHLVYGKCNSFMVDGGVLCATWHKMISKSTNPKIKTSGLIQNVQVTTLQK